MVAVVAVLLMSGAAVGAWLWLSGGSQDELAAGAQKQLDLVFAEDIPEDWETDLHNIEMTVGSWLDGYWWIEGKLVREMPDEVVAYNLADGSVAWRVPVEGNGTCRASRAQSPEGYVAILRGDGTDNYGSKACNVLTVVDIKAGKEVWTKQLEPGRANTLPTVGDRAVIFGDSVYVSSDAGGRRLSLADGTAPESSSSDSCGTSDYRRIDDTLLAWKEGCGALVAFDQNREMRWVWEFPDDQDDKHLVDIVSLDPVVVVVKSGVTEEVWRVKPGSGENDPGKHTVLATINDEKYRSPCGLNAQGSELNDCPRVVVGDGVFYLQTVLGQGERRKGLAGLDLESGKELWRTQAQGQEGELSLTPLRMDDDGRLLVYRPQYDPVGDDEGTPALVLAADPKDGSLETLAALPYKHPDLSSGNNAVLENAELDEGLEWHDGRLAYISTKVVVTRPGRGGGAGSTATLLFG